MIEPLSVSREDFPANPDTAPGMISLPVQPRRPTLFCHTDVEYLVRGGRPLYLQVICPSLPGGPLPLVVFIPGSAWHKQNVPALIPQLSALAFRGFAVALLEYRPSDEAPFPAQVLDAKAGIRFMKENAARFNIDPGRVVVMGDSSGGHTAMLAGFTDGIGELEEVDHAPDGPAAVRGVVDFYGPVNIAEMNETSSIMDHRGPDSPEGFLIGRRPVLENPGLVRPTVVTNYISPGREIPPILIFHGDRDELVSFSQSCSLCRALSAAGKDAAFYRIPDAHHGGPEFWADPVLDLVEAFIRRVTA